MKCKHCNGTGKVRGYFYEKTGANKWEKVWGDSPCDECNGTGEIQQTEQEYIQTCDTEQLVKVFGSMLFEAWKDGLAEEMHDKRFYENLVDFWLKQPHTPQKQDDCPCNVKGCSLETRQACCGCPDYFEWEKQNR